MTNTEHKKPEDCRKLNNYLKTLKVVQPGEPNYQVLKDYFKNNKDHFQFESKFIEGTHYSGGLDRLVQYQNIAVLDEGTYKQYNALCGAHKGYTQNNNNILLLKVERNNENEIISFEEERITQKKYEKLTEPQVGTKRKWTEEVGAPSDNAEKRARGAEDFSWAR